MISEKQKKILAFPYSKYDTLICDGAVRSGKTSIMTVAFIDWAMREFSGKRFGICGKTVGSATENMIKPYMAMLYARKRYTLKWRRFEKILEVSRGSVKNLFEIFGGKDESSYELIQGRTLAGVLLDEVVLMPESFVNQALARCSVDEARMWFSCNPDNPGHWFYTKWIERRKERNALYLHFSMTDNPSLSQKTLRRYESTYTGVFYQRYILGEWVAAEGLIYPMYDNTVPTIDREYIKYAVSMDYGIQNPTAMLLWGLCGGVWYLVREYYHSGRDTNEQKTDQQYYEELERLCGKLPIWKLIIDPSASSFITLCNQKKKFKILKANNDVIDGIRHTASVLSEKKLLINDCCKNTIREFGLYSWDDNTDEDRPIKENDHCMDALRYMVNTLRIWKPKTEYHSIF
ncbi:MAG: PBSX family phage terminase large subunit [Clostridium sp.]|nr:PBSX family phage terminase large subunit [Clostridium sp.]MCM1547930.1 PBSX family phage terminase large subunit [Ruminococcus sp.]